MKLAYTNPALVGIRIPSNISKYLSENRRTSAPHAKKGIRITENTKVIMKTISHLFKDILFKFTVDVRTAQNKKSGLIATTGTGILKTLTAFRYPIKFVKR